MYDLMLATLAALLTLQSRWLARGWSNPFPIFFLVWMAILAAHALLPIGIIPTSGGAALVIGTGLLGFFVGFLAAHGPSDFRPVTIRVSTIRWISAVAVVSAGITVGIVSFRDGIASLSGRSYAGLTRQEVLYYQNYGERPVGGKTLLLSLTVTLAGLGVLQLQRSKWVGILVLLGAVAASVQSPSRTLTLTLAGSSYVFWLYTRSLRSSRAFAVVTRVRTHPKPAIVLVLVTLAGLAYFNAEGSALHKEDDNLNRPLGSLTTPVVYGTGSLSALSVAIDKHISPTAGSNLRSLWLIPRVLALVSPVVKAPETVAGFVPIPDPYNTYTMFGDIYFDFGIAGVLVISLLFGLLVERMHKRARATNSLTSSWMAAVLIAIMFGGIVTFRLFWLDSALWLVVGSLLMSRIGAGRDSRRYRRVPQ